MSSLLSVSLTSAFATFINILSSLQHISPGIALEE